MRRLRGLERVVVRLLVTAQALELQRPAVQLAAAGQVLVAQRRQAVAQLQVRRRRQVARRRRVAPRR
jgi:hypothetical protein